MAAEPQDLLYGTLDVLILRTLAWGTQHGYGISKALRERTKGTFEVEDAPLYKALHRLENEGSIAAEWGLSENNRRARYYKLTPRGRGALRSGETAWRKYAAAVLAVFEGAPAR